ncbi:DUF2079 domain-containing protein [Candidatus Chloroploca sp. M-50]|uniref:DUF2079 domain-containing protein n=1 Tax=Candidatus Chloroploca mongolica TaxID=2528176 RepID=A0ABS4DE66_9CHLR|nr:DUF2079 domain-containing protein [Candidatus Chloroploca mongolica]MBP1467715.1 DUF2079 domain-containing protein [Candidatus Chloroploca mongolica]
MDTTFTEDRTPSLPRDRFLWVAMLVVAVVLVGLSLARYWGYNAGMLDLGNMTQAILSVLRGQPLVTTGPGGNVSRLAGHVEVIYLAFVPLLALWPNPQPLLIGQALLMVAGALPAYRMALRHLEDVAAARSVALIYLLYPVALTAVLFDFHGDTLAMPLLLFALDAADRQAWRWYAFWIALSLLSKVYVAAPVFGIGAFLWFWAERRRAGTWTMLAAALYGSVVFFGVRGLFVPSATGLAVTSGYVNHYYGDLQQVWGTLLPRLVSALLVFGPVLFLGWRGWRWLLPAAPLTLAVLLSTGPGAVYHYAYHHYALVVPFVVMAVIDGAVRLRQQAAEAAPDERVRQWKPDLIFTTVIVAVVSLLMVDQPLNPRFWLALPGQGLDHARYGRVARDEVKDRFLAAELPDTVPLAASMFLAPRLVDREKLYLVRYPDDPGGERLPSLLPEVEYVLADALFDWRTLTDAGILPTVAYEEAEIRALLADPAFGLVAARDGLLLFQRDAPAARVLSNTITLTSTVEFSAKSLDLGPATLRGFAVNEGEGRRFEATFVWELNGSPPATPWVAISQLGVASDTRLVHLPTYVVQPITTWPADQLIYERFVFEVPDDIPAGRYEWQVAWYDATHPEAAFSDGEALPPGIEPVVVGTILVP